MWNNTFKVVLPSPTTQSGSFSVSVPIGVSGNVAVRSNNVYLQFVIQTPSAQAVPPLESRTYMYRPIPQIFNDTTQTQLENFAGFVNITTVGYILTQIQVLT